MKCFKLFLIMFIVCFGVLGQDTVERDVVSKIAVPITPEKQYDIQTGDIVTIKVELPEGLPADKIVGKTVGDIFYIAQQKDKSDLFEAVVTNPKGKVDKGLENYSFIVQGFNFTPKRIENIPTFLTKSLTYDEERSYKFLFVLIPLLVFIIAIGWAVIGTVYKKRKKKKAFLEQADKLIMQIKSAKERGEIEDIYRNRKLIAEYLDTEKKEFIEFFNVLNSVQYQQAWNEIDYEKVKASLSALKSNLEVKSGI